MRVELWTDGSSSGASGGAGGFAALLRALDGDEVVKEAIVQGGEPDTTNQRMELTACLEGLRMLHRATEVTIYTDSAYLMNCFVQKWYLKWERNGWLNIEEEPVANADLWKALLEAARPHGLTWVKLKGHVKTKDRKGAPKLCEHEGCECRGDMALHDLNGRVDELAVEAKQAIKEHGTVGGILLSILSEG